MTNAVADGVAFTLGTDLADRKATKKLVKDLYEVRSRITHGGEVLVTQQNLSQLRYAMRMFGRAPAELLRAVGLDAPGTRQVFYGLVLLVIIIVQPAGVWPWLARLLGLEKPRS